jgi:hypothetical protein
MTVNVRVLLTLACGAAEPKAASAFTVKVPAVAELGTVTTPVVEMVEPVVSLVMVQVT